MIIKNIPINSLKKIRGNPRHPCHPRSISIIILFLIVCFTGSAFAGNQAQASEADDQTFIRGYELFEKGKYKKAAPYFYRYLRNHSSEDAEHDWAEFFLGISLRKIGLSHAAVDVLADLVKRNPNPKIVLYCLELFEKIVRTIPFDRDLIIREIIAGQEYGFVEGEVANFVHYYQGVFDWEHGFFEWGSEHFSHIEPRTYYFYSYLYKKALYAISMDKIDGAMNILQQILSGAETAEHLQDEARHTLARLFYEKDMFEESVHRYKQIKKPTVEQVQNLLELAWSQFRMGNAEKAMGILYAYRAPTFKQFFTPEYFMLKSFIYKDACHYNRAMSMVSEFKKQYMDSINIIYSRGEPADNHSLLLALLTKRKIKQLWEFLDLLEQEKGKIQFADRNFTAYIEKIYDFQIKQTASVFKKEVNKEYEEMANRLLQYEEEANLMEYEIGLDMYRRIYQFHYEDEDSSKNEKISGSTVVYPFQGEFWNDELADYGVTLPDKCENMEEWDIFFK